MVHLRRGFTLIELMVVLLIILLVSVVALPPVVATFRSRQSSEAGRLLQGALAGARDDAIHSGQPSGIRLLPDPTLTTYDANGQITPYGVLAYNRIIPIRSAPDYSEGRITFHADGAGGSSQYPAAIRTVNGYPGVPCLVLEQAKTDSTGLPNPPTGWEWNIRIGDQIQVGNAGTWYTVVGPMVIGPGQGNTELFVNYGLAPPHPPNQPIVWPPQLGGIEYLLLTNGRDDNGNGWIDEGWDGVDNNGDGRVDDAAEWEQERWVR